MDAHQLPPLPAAVWSPLGPIAVQQVAGLETEDGLRLYGRYNYETRTIDIDTGPLLLMQWQTLYHEWLHSVLHDHGFDLGPFEEPVIDTIATALMAWWLADQSPSSAPSTSRPDA